MAHVITGQQISNFQLVTWYYALSLETLGMTRRGESAYSIVKRACDLKGTKISVFAQMGTMLVKMGLMEPEKHEKNLRRLKLDDETLAKYLRDME